MYQMLVYIRLLLQTLMVEFTDLVSQSYAVVARYYQPDDVGFPVNVTVDVNGVMYTGYFDAPYCPNTAGCNRLVWFITCLCCQRS